MKKYSLLGLVLVAASAVTVAMQPSKAAKSKAFSPGKLALDPNNEISCTASGTGAACTVTAINTHTGAADLGADRTHYDVANSGLTGTTKEPS